MLRTYFDFLVELEFIWDRYFSTRFENVSKI